MVLTGSENNLEKGDTAPNFELLGVNGGMHRLDEIRGDSATLIVFMCNHCPYVIPKIDELIRIATDFENKGLTVIGINPNEDKNYPEDSYEKMVEMAKYKGINFYYLRDETQAVAKAYGAVCTPDPFLFDGKLKLVFHSRIDDTHGSDTPNRHEMYEAIEEFLKTGKITLPESPSMGCSIKWKY
jgi:peroxiredoxin